MDSSDEARDALAAAQNNIPTDGASITDLKPEDKAKVGNLLRELAKAQRDGAQAREARGRAGARSRARHATQTQN